MLNLERLENERLLEVLDISDDYWEASMAVGINMSNNFNYNYNHDYGPNYGPNYYNYDYKHRYIDWTTPYQNYLGEGEAYD